MPVLKEGHQARVPRRSRDDRPEGRNDHESTRRKACNRKEMNRDHDPDSEEANTVNLGHVSTAGGTAGESISKFRPAIHFDA